MRECLQDDLENVHLQKTRSYQRCVRSSEEIEEGEYAVSIHSGSYIVWVSLDWLDELAALCRRVSDAPEDLSSVDGVRSTIYKHDSHVTYRDRPLAPSCPCCEEEFGIDERVMALYDPREDKSARAQFHPTCGDRLATALERVWEAGGEELLTDAL